MSAEQLTQGVHVGELEKIIVRVVFIAPELDRDGKAANQAVLYLFRAAYANSEPYTPSLPGGKLSHKDFQKVVSSEHLTQHDYEVTPEELLACALFGAVREALEELGWVLATHLLTFLSDTESGGWRTISFVAQLGTQPEVNVDMREATGYIWLNAQKILAGDLRPVTHLLPGHLGITQHGLRSSGVVEASKSEAG